MQSSGVPRAAHVSVMLSLNSEKRATSTFTSTPVPTVVATTVKDPAASGNRVDSAHVVQLRGFSNT